MRTVARLVLRPVMVGWGRSVVRGLDRGPLPIDNPRAHARGVDSDSILIFGGGAAVGWGVLSHSLALPGALARAVSALTGRGTDVEVISSGDSTAARAVTQLAQVDLHRFDAVIVILGLNESVELASPSAWRNDLERVLDYLAANRSPGATVYVVGVHSPTVITPFDAVVAPFVTNHCDELNGITEQICALRHRMVFIGSAPVRRHDETRSRSPEDYRVGASIIASMISPELDRHFAATVHSRRLRDEDGRQAGLDALEIVDTGPEERFDRIVSLARRAFGT
ncbi:MAG: diguanylate cyclase, partial [Novosphingobium sp.]|nr:diguanylate cyclase [Novosphingobium sp.]